jgi:hypothetical protein
MDSAFTPLLEFEMFHGVGDIDLRSVKSCVCQGLIEQPARRTHERAALPVFFVARLFAHQHDSRGGRTFAKNNLLCELEQITALARRCCFAQNVQGMVAGYEGLGCLFLNTCHPFKPSRPSA